MRLSKFVAIKDRDQPSANLILCTEYPFPVFQIWKFKTENEFTDFISKVPIISKLPEGLMLVAFKGALIGDESYMPFDERQDHTDAAAIWYWSTLSDHSKKWNLKKHSV